MSSLVQVIYRSKSSEPLLARSGWTDFHDSLKIKNQVKGITGILMFDGSYFLQVLEGEALRVFALYEDIKSDSRHSGVVTIISESVSRRRFDSWSSCLIQNDGKNQEWSGLSLREIRSYIPMDINAKVGSLATHRVSTIVEAFARGLWDDRMHKNAPTQRIKVPSVVTHLTDRQRLEFQKFGADFAYQPIVDLRTNQISGYEALIRGKGGQSPADLFRGMSGGTLHMFDLRSKAWAIAVSSKLQPQGNLSINLLPQSLLVLTDAAETLMENVLERGLAPEQITVEITEEEIITSPDLFHRAIEKLRAFGFMVSIDDFGSGYAGLSLLVDFQPDTLKIDRRIVQGIDSHGPRQAIVRAIIDFCFSLGIGVVAEGVETSQEMRWLTGAGVDKVQGFLLAKPMVMGLPAIDWDGGY